VICNCSCIFLTGLVLLLWRAHNEMFIAFQKKFYNSVTDGYIDSLLVKGIFFLPAEREDK
jgi:hypothetical protein